MSPVVKVENVSRDFRKYYQQTFKEFLTDRRAKKAQHLVYSEEMVLGKVHY